MNQTEYRALLRSRSTIEVSKMLIDVRNFHANTRASGEGPSITENWQARELLAELYRRQLKLF